MFEIASRGRSGITRQCGQVFIDLFWINLLWKLTEMNDKKGIFGMRSSSPASTSLYLDSEVLHNPFQAILPTLAVIVKPTTVGVSN